MIFATKGFLFTRRAGGQVSPPGKHWSIYTAERCNEAQGSKHRDLLVALLCGAALIPPALCADFK